MLAWFVAAAGLLGVLDAVLPNERPALIASLAPEHVHGVSEALVAPLGLVLLVAARGLARGKRRAWQVALAVLLGLIALHLQHRFGYGAIATALVAVALLARRSDFDAPGDPEAHPRIALRALLFGSAIFGYAFGALWINRVMADQSFTLPFVVREAARGAVGVNATGSDHLSGTFGEWFPLSLLLLTLTAVGILLLDWLAPWRYRHAEEARHRALTRDLVTVWGADTLAPFVLRGDKSYFFDDDERAFIAYKVVGGVAIVSGDPIGPHERVSRADRSVSRLRARAWLARCDSRRLGGRSRKLSRARPARPVPRRRGGRRHGGVLPRRARDPQGEAVGASTRTRRLHGDRDLSEPDRSTAS